MQRKTPLRTGPGDVSNARAALLAAAGKQDALVALNATNRWHNDFYYSALTTSWPLFLGVLALLFVAVNAVFAGLYLLQPGAISGARPGNFGDAFFFSVQTLATIGYGKMFPATLYANLMVTAEVVVGGLMLAMVAGLAFARFSRPSARVVFSRVAAVGPVNGKPTLSLRVGNERHDQILQAEVRLALVRDEQTAEGHFLRRIYDLDLVRSATPVFPMTFLVMHVIDEVSPLHGATPEMLDATQSEIVLILTGLDAALSQVIQARISYKADQVLFGRRFADVIGAMPDGRRAVDYARFHETEPV